MADSGGLPPGAAWRSPCTTNRVRANRESVRPARRRMTGCMRCWGSTLDRTMRKNRWFASTRKASSCSGGPVRRSLWSRDGVPTRTMNTDGPERATSLWPSNPGASAASPHAQTCQLAEHGGDRNRNHGPAMHRTTYRHRGVVTDGGPAAAAERRGTRHRMEIHTPGCRPQAVPPLCPVMTLSCYQTLRLFPAWSCRLTRFGYFFI